MIAGSRPGASPEYDLKAMEEKLKLFKLLHGTEYVYVGKDGTLHVLKPPDFTGIKEYWQGLVYWKFEWKNGKMSKMTRKYGDEVAETGWAQK